MRSINKEKLTKEINALAESKISKRGFLIENFDAIDGALEKGVGLKKVLNTIKKTTGLEINIAYAYIVLREHREAKKLA